MEVPVQGARGGDHDRPDRREPRQAGGDGREAGGQQPQGRPTASTMQVPNRQPRQGRCNTSTCPRRAGPGRFIPAPSDRRAPMPTVSHAAMLALRNRVRWVDRFGGGGEAGKACGQQVGASRGGTRQSRRQAPFPCPAGREWKDLGQARTIGTPASGPSLTPVMWSGALAPPLEIPGCDPRRAFFLNSAARLGRSSRCVIVRMSMKAVVPCPLACLLLLAVRRHRARRRQGRAPSVPVRTSAPESSLDEMRSPRHFRFRPGQLPGRREGRGRGHEGREGEQ